MSNSSTIKRFSGLTATLACASAVFLGVAGTASTAAAAPAVDAAGTYTDTRTGDTPENWAPVPRLNAVDSGPQPGTTCTKRGERREFVVSTGAHFGIEGEMSTVNDTEGVVPLQQTLKETKTKKWTWSASISVNLTKEIAQKYQWEYNREMIWSLGQNIGPYDLNPGEKGTLAWGFIMDDYTSQQVRCGKDLTWEEHGRLNSGSAPRERHVEVKIEKQ